jgi:UDP-N-acetylmuramyl pentapeptide synthase
MHSQFTGEEILYATNGHLKSGTISDTKGKLTWNIDELKAGDWFLAIPSTFRDPHDCLNLAFEKGASGVIVNRRNRYSSAIDGGTIITVSDTRTALLDLVRHWRFKVKPRVVAVSGSFGRQVTMLLLNQLLKETFITHVASMGNLGWFGCIEEVLSMPEETEVLIFEAGAIERGDITRIGGALVPDFAVLTQIRHPLPSQERDSFAAALYCELLETLAEQPQGRLAAAIYDLTIPVRNRVDELLDGCNLMAARYSKSESSLASQVTDAALAELSDAMKKVVGQSVTRAELWCAIEAASALGVSDSKLMSQLNLQPVAALQ